MQIRPFNPIDISVMQIQDGQTYIKDIDLTEYASLTGYTMYDGNKIIVSAGFLKIHNTRHIAWAVFSKESGKYMNHIVRAMRRNLNIIYGRIEMTCDVNFPPAHRLARMLGFTLECPCMKNYEINGADSAMYAKINFTN